MSKSKYRLWRYEVSGFGQFPFDMLRYDAAWPASERDAGAIERAEHANRWTVGLHGVRPPTTARWQSFLVQVKNVTDEPLWV